MAKKDRKNQEIEGFNPRQFRSMSIVFAVLSIINIIAVTLAFTRTGYGLYHAEDALSHISEITSSVQSMNESVLEIILNNEDPGIVKEQILNIEEMRKKVEESEKAYKEIDVDTIDPRLKEKFEKTMDSVSDYQYQLEQFTKSTFDGLDANAIHEDYAQNVKTVKDKAEAASIEMFELQQKTTYEFFVRTAQQFLFVLLFLIITLVVGLLGIRLQKKRARVAAMKLAQEHQRAVNSRSKVIDIAYSNILTGFKNRYGLEDDLVEALSNKSFDIAICNFNHFRSVNNTFGRDVGDVFVSTVSSKIREYFSAVATIYSTDTDEFCFVFKEQMNPIHLEQSVQQIVKMLSLPYEVGSETIQLTVSSCFYQCMQGSQISFNSLFRTLDYAMNLAKDECTRTGGNAVINVNYLNQPHP